MSHLLPLGSQYSLFVSCPPTKPPRRKQYIREQPLAAWVTSLPWLWGVCAPGSWPDSQEVGKRGLSPGTADGQRRGEQDVGGLLKVNLPGFHFGSLCCFCRAIVFLIIWGRGQITCGSWWTKPQNPSLTQLTNLIKPLLTSPARTDPSAPVWGPTPLRNQSQCCTDVHFSVSS